MAEIYVVYMSDRFFQVGIRGVEQYANRNVYATISYKSSKTETSTYTTLITDDDVPFNVYYYTYFDVDYEVTVTIGNREGTVVIETIGPYYVAPQSRPTLYVTNITTNSVTLTVDHFTEADVQNGVYVNAFINSEDATKPSDSLSQKIYASTEPISVTFPLKYTNSPYSAEGYLVRGANMSSLETDAMVRNYSAYFTSLPTALEAGIFEKVTANIRELDWTKSMEQTFEFYIVDPGTWRDSKRIDTVTSCSIERDSSNATLGSASFECTENVDECYIRAYLIATQNGITERVPLGTFLVQTPSVSFDGKNTSISLEAYTPLIELKSTVPPIGYALLKGTNIMDTVPDLCAENMRAPVVGTSSDEKVYDDFVSNLDDTWLSFISDLLANAKFQFGLDEYSRVIFEPVQDPAALRPVWVYNDDNSSILLPDISNERDLYGIPNVVEVVYSTGTGYMFSRIVNDDPNSPVSTVNRGREVVHRESSPNFAGMPTQEYIDQYARQMLRNMSCLEHKVTYSHGYCPVRVGDAVLLNYTRAGLTNVKAKVISQSIKCDTGCTVEETAVYTTKLWR